MPVVVPCQTLGGLFQQWVSSECVWHNCLSFYWPMIFISSLLRTSGRGQLKCDGTRAETRFRLSAKRTSLFKSAVGRQFSRLLAAVVCASAVVMLHTPCSEVVWRVLATHSIRQFPLHFPTRASPCAVTFQLESNKPAAASGWVRGKEERSSASRLLKSSVHRYFRFTERFLL